MGDKLVNRHAVLILLTATSSLGFVNWIYQFSVRDATLNKILWILERD